jgi:type VI secretion system ImpB/VipA family protein
MPKKSSSSQKLLPRKPRVQIEYDVETGGAIRKVELPWVTGVLADLSGANEGELPDLKDRKFSDVDADNFDEYLKSQKPRVQFSVDNLISGEGRIGVDVTFDSLEEFRPDLVARKVGAEIEDVRILREKNGSGHTYRIEQDGPGSLALGETIESLDKLQNVTFVAYKLGVQPADIEVQLLPDVRDPNKSVLRITRKGPLAKLLDARNQLKELLIKVDGNSSAKKELEKLLGDRELLSGIVDAGNAGPAMDETAG